MNNPIKLLISGADMGSLIASCALHHDFHKSSRQEDRFQIYRIEKDTLTMEDVDVLVDGEFIVEQKDTSLYWRGSSNQRVIDVRNTRKTNQIVLHCK